MYKAKLSKHRLNDFSRFLQERGESIESASLASKLRWLASIVNDPQPPPYGSLKKARYALLNVGSDADLELQNTVLEAFVLEQKNNRSLPLGRLWTPALPSKVFREIVRELEPLERFDWQLQITLEDANFRRARVRLAIKVAWFTGLHSSELAVIQTDWLEPHSKGYILTFVAQGRRRDRTLLIPRLDDVDSSLCPARELESWLENIPKRPGTYLLPFSDRQCVINWERKLYYNFFTVAFSRLIEKMGLSKYTFVSLRRSFLKKCADEYGSPTAFYLSGLTDPRSLAQSLRGEPDWARAKSLLG